MDLAVPLTCTFLTLFGFSNDFENYREESRRVCYIIVVVVSS